MHREMPAACAGVLWLMPLVFALGGCSREPAPPQFDPMSEQDITRLVENAIVNTMGDPEQTDHQRRIALEELRYAESDTQIKVTHSMFNEWRRFENKHPRHWYHKLGFGAASEPARAITISALRMSAEGAIEQACGISSASANRQAAFLNDGFSVDQLASAYAKIDRDLARCMSNRRDTIKSLKEMTAPAT